jgi:hypothetical protein
MRALESALAQRFFGRDLARLAREAVAAFEAKRELVSLAADHERPGVVREMMRFADRDQVEQLVGPAVLAMNNVMNVDVRVRATARHATPELITLQDLAPRCGRDVLTRTLDERRVEIADPLRVAHCSLDIRR